MRGVTPGMAGISGKGRARGEGVDKKRPVLEVLMLLRRIGGYKMIVQTLLLAAASIPTVSLATSEARLAAPPEFQSPKAPQPVTPYSPPNTGVTTESFKPVPLEDPQIWFRADRLDAKFGARLANTTISWRALISFDGKVLNCFVTKSFDDIPLETKTCDIVRQWGRFNPARDEQGRAVMTYYQGNARWSGLRLRPPDPVVKSQDLLETQPRWPPSVQLIPTASVARSFPAKAELRSRSWLSSDDYPPAALRRFEEGNVGFRAYVGSDGRVFACGIEQSATDLLDTETCKIAIRRLRFHPALDAKGDPIRDVYATRVMWRIPNDPILPVRFVKTGGEKVELRLLVGKRRKIIECTAYSAKPEIEALSQQICAAYEQELKASRLNEAKGSPLPGAANISVRIAMSNDS
jgi:Gram-negative bacterial TonB protein C-terminal